MAEIVPLDRAGDWRRRRREEEEVAVGVRGGLPGRQGPAHPMADWLGGNINHVDAPTFRSLADRDIQIIVKLLSSGKVNPSELLSYHTPLPLLNQGRRIDPINGGITSTINDMARSRRELLLMKLKKKIKENERKQIARDLARWPVKIQQMQGEVSELKGRYVRIPAILVTDIELLS